MKDYSALLKTLVSSEYEITEGKYPVYMIMGQSNAHTYIGTQMQAMLDAVGAFGYVYVLCHPGQVINYWFNAEGVNTGYTSDMAFIDQLGEQFEVRAIFWLQGGYNALYGMLTHFQEYTEGFFDAVITHLGYTPDFNITKSSYFGDDGDVISNMVTLRELQDTIAGEYTGRKHDGIHYPRVDDWHLNMHNYKMLGYDLLTGYAKQKTGAF